MTRAILASGRLSLVEIGNAAPGTIGVGHGEYRALFDASNDVALSLAPLLGQRVRVVVESDEVES